MRVRLFFLPLAVPHYMNRSTVSTSAAAALGAQQQQHQATSPLVCTKARSTSDRAPNWVLTPRAGVLFATRIIFCPSFSIS